MLPLQSFMLLMRRFDRNACTLKDRKTLGMCVYIRKRTDRMLRHPSRVRLVGLLKRFHVRQLLETIPRSRIWLATADGRRLLSWRYNCIARAGRNSPLLDDPIFFGPCGEAKR